MIRTFLRLWLALAGGGLAESLAATPPAPSATALQGSAFAVRVDRAAPTRPLLQIGPVLDDEDLARAAGSGLPIRLRARVELWRDALFDRLVATESWSAVLLYEPLESRYIVSVRTDPPITRGYATYEDARAALHGNYPIPFRPTRPGRYYYAAVLEVETLSLSDLEELETWLRGELRPAIRGERPVGGAVEQGVRRLMIRVLGLPTRRYEATSDRFRVS